MWEREADAGKEKEPEVREERKAAAGIERGTRA
jgi:hypothetical protein